MKNFSLFLFFFTSLFLSAQNTTCATTAPFCTANGVDFPNSINAGNAEAGPSYGCLGGDTPNPSWFYLKIDAPGDLFMLIEQNSSADFTGAGLDVDFVAWGPFTEAEFLAGVCGDLTASNIVPGDGTSGAPNTSTSQGCSYSPNATENFNIIGANTGEYFVLLITNWDNDPGFVRMNQTNPKGGSTDCSILNSTLGPDLKACNTIPATPVILDGTTTGAIGYTWYFDNGSGFSLIPGETNSTLSVLLPGTYQVEVSDGINTDTDEVVVTFYNTPTAVQPSNMVLCDDDNNGTMPFILTNQNTIINTDVGMSITYYLTQAEADIGATGILSSPYESGSTTIYVRVENDANVNCYDTTSFDLEVYDTPVVVQPPNMIQCDDDNNGTMPFVLTDQDAIINNDSGMSITYHSTQLDAETSAVSSPISSPFESGTTTIYVRVENDVNVECYDTTSFDLEVYDTPTAIQPPNMVLCDDDNNGTMPFILTNQDIIINTDVGMSITYYLSQVEADSGTAGALLSPYESGSTTVYARVENDANIDCYDTTSFDLEVYDSAFPSTTVSLLGECDNTSVGTDIDGFIVFNLTDRSTEILNGQTATDFTLTYFTDAAYTIQIPLANETAFINTVASGQTIYVRMTNNANTGCYSDTSFEIEVFVFPVLDIALAPYELVQCDDPSNDAEANFNLNQANGDIINPITTETFIYYTSQALAEAGVAGTEIPDATVFNVTGSTDDVWVRIVTDHGCYRVAMVHLIIRPSQINPEYQLYQCDDFLDIDGNDTAANNDTDGVATFDFQNEIDLILAPFSGTAGVSISCHHTEADADAGLNPIDPTTYSNYRNNVSPNLEQIWVRVVSSLGNDCLANGNFITLHVNPIPSLNTVLDMEDCDNGNDGDDTNGIGVEFNLENQTNLIRQVGMSAADFPLTYHLSYADAVSGASPQSSPYSNITNAETIYVRVTNAITGCVNPHITFDLDVNPLPIVNFTSISLSSQCDNDDDGDDTNGIGVEFDLGSLRNDFENLQPDISTVTYTVTYHSLLTDAQANPPLNPLSDLYVNTANNQSIFVRIENDNTGCIRIEEAVNYLIVDELPILTPIIVNPKCDNDNDGDDTNGVVTWNLDSYIAPYNAMQITVDPVTVTFHTSLIGANSAIPSDIITNLLTYENISNPQEIFVRIENNITGCYRGMYVFDLIVNPKPEFDLIDRDLVCENLLPHSISAENPDANDYTYEWFNSSGTSIGTNQTIEITNTSDITTTGVDYSVIVTNPITGCARIKTINLWKSSSATFLDSDIVTVEFNSPENSITIKTTTLGSGDYEFKLEHPSDTRQWQDEPVFTNLQGGMYTVLINDKNGCGEVFKVIFLLDYPKFLTPNNDGYNDYWQLIGLDSSTFTISPIQIFDRFGKIVAIINPTQGQGWGGLYKNEMLPSSDYWFVLSLTNNLGEAKIHKGHFSLIRR